MDLILALKQYFAFLILVVEVFAFVLASIGDPNEKVMHRNDNNQIETLTLAFVSKTNLFTKRERGRFFKKALDVVHRDATIPSFHNSYRLAFIQDDFNEYSPPEAFKILCDTVLKHKATAIFLLSEIDSIDYVYKTVSADYLLQMANFLGIPALVWAEDNSGLIQPNTESTVLQMTPSIEHQARAMLSLLQRYNWPAFAVVTGSLSGHEYFVNILRQLIEESTSPFEMLTVVSIPFTVNGSRMKDLLNKLLKHEARVILLYATQKEGERILSTATEIGQTGKDYIWILCKSMLGAVSSALNERSLASSSFFPGILAVDFNMEASVGERSRSSLLSTPSLRITHEKAILMAVAALAQGIDKFSRDQQRRPEMMNFTLIPTGLACDINVQQQWKEGLLLSKYLKNVSFFSDNSRIAFNADGTMQDVELRIVNLDQSNKWQEIGAWSSSRPPGSELQMGDITWPGGELTPPKGRPAKYHLRVVTLQEKPYVVYSDPDPVLGTCPSQAELCRIAPLNVTQQIGLSNATTNSKLYQCCSGFCIDLLKMLSEKIGFDFELFEVPDKKWGAFEKVTQKWNGLVKSIVDGDADMIVTSMQITPDRSQQIDFSVPFLETGITILVAVRDGVISPTAFLEPYDYPSWCLILLFSVHASGAAIFIVEWLSPHGLDRGEKPIRDHKFSLFRSFWLIWSMLFGAAVNVDNPRGVSSRFLANIWAFFAVVFTASYTANLAAFMITKEDYDRLTGLQDKKLVNPHVHKPPFKYATVPHGSTETNLMNYYPEMYNYMKGFNKSNAIEGVNAVRDGTINAFIYDATVLEYLASIDDGCKLRTVGTWSAKTGYGIGFPKASRWIQRVNKYMVKFQHDGELERLQKFWLAGSCKKNEAKGEASKPLAILNFTSAFILLACGMILGSILMVVEHLYFNFFRAKLRRCDRYGCCSLVSLSLGKSLTFQQSVKEAIEMQRHHKCKNPVCEMQVWKLRHELDLARLSIARLQKTFLKGDNSNADDKSVSAEGTHY